ncbi:MAG: serine--tRNA ligase, partial [Armatimonadetes bacterium]|nr:serine--tRNA ligase [Armatimonadota bacterium]
MIDLKLIRDNPDLVRAGILKKQGDPALVDRILEKDLERRTALQQVETLRAEQNRASKEVPRLQGEERERRTAELRDLSSRLKGLEADLAAIERALETLLLLVPNPPHESVPPGRDERDNVTLRTWGAPPKFDFPPLDHVDLGRRLGIFDLERGAKVSGSRFYFLRGAGVLLEQALTRFSLDLLRREGFTLVTTPMLIRTEVILGAMGGDRIDDQQVYRIVDEDLGLIGTSEHAMLGMFKDEVLEETQLPIRLAGLSWCFRREAGSWGKDVRGIYRVHQFEKVEMFSFCHPDRSWEEHEYLLSR